MPSIRTATTFAVALLLALAAKSQTATPTTLGNFLLERQREFMTPSAAFCSAEFPDQAAEFWQANDRFKKVVVEATKGLRDRFAEDLSKPVPASVLAFDPARTFAERGRAQGAGKFCPQVLQTMRTATVEAMRQVTENAFSQMEAAAAARNGASGAGK